MSSKKLIFLSFFLYPSALMAQTGTITRFTIDPSKKAQAVQNIGASGCWFSEGIGKYWPSEKREQIAEWLFSKELDASGNPKGIGLSAWRFNIGGGTAEQGEESGIKDFRRRVECFQNPDGSYDWSKQEGYIWFVKKAKEYGVENLIAFSNTPPVQFTRNGLGYKTEKDYTSNLKPDKYDDYADFLVDVLEHFDKEDLHFNYISPVNEPQWDWSNKPGQASQEGSPWKNDEIYKVITALDSTLTARKLRSKIMTTEAGMLDYLFRNDGRAGKQIQHFKDPQSPMQFYDLPNMAPFIGGHSYFTDGGDTNRIRIRQMLRDTARKYNIDFWQTEYSMLGDGYKEGKKGRRSAMDCGLFLAKLIHTDLVTAEAGAWHLWNSYEPGNPDWDTRYYLIALQPNATHTDGEFQQTKGLWAMGNFSRFIRPGMRRINVQRGDGRDEFYAAQQVMVSAYANKDQQVIVAVNYTEEAQSIQLEMGKGKKSAMANRYVTSAAAEDNLKAYPKVNIRKPVALAPRSVTTFVVER